MTNYEFNEQKKKIIFYISPLTSDQALTLTLHAK